MERIDRSIEWTKADIFMIDMRSFNGGPRICPGQVFSTFETTYILARMAQEFKWVERRDAKMGWEPVVGLSTLNRLGAKVALAKA